MANVVDEAVVFEWGLYPSVWVFAASSGELVFLPWMVVHSLLFVGVVAPPPPRRRRGCWLMWRIVASGSLIPLEQLRICTRWRRDDLGCMGTLWDGPSTYLVLELLR